MIVLPTRLPSYHNREYGLEELRNIRLICRANPLWIFELQRYTFPVGTPLKLKVRHGVYEPLLTQEQIVMTFEGDAFAILENTYLLAGIYVYQNSEIKRAKINMRSGLVTALTTQEIDKSPVGSQRPLLRYFRINRVHGEKLV